MKQRTRYQQVQRLVGKTIKQVTLRPFPSGRPENPRAYDPRIEFTDGTVLVFNVQETEVGAYGVDLDVIG